MRGNDKKRLLDESPINLKQLSKKFSILEVDRSHFSMITFPGNLGDVNLLQDT